MTDAPIFKDKNLIRNGGLIGEKWVTKSSTGKTFKIDDPATEKTISELPEMGKTEVEEAIDVAAKAFKEFKKTTPRERATMLRKLYNLMMDNVEDLAKIIAWENGKSWAESKGEVQYAASFFEWYAEEAPRIYGATIPSAVATNRMFTVREPVGVCGIMCPWNFPSAMITRKVGAAIAAGCTVIVKPDSQTPLSGLAIAYLASKAGIPSGVFNVILASENTSEVGKILCESPKVKKVSFTGSTRVGKILMSQSASSLKKLSMELGGNAPFIVFADADLQNAVEQAIFCKFRGFGQTCVCTNRLYVQSSIIDKFTDMLAKKIEEFVIGPGLDPKNTHGCVINKTIIEKVDKHAKDAITKGAEVILKGGPLPDLGPNFYSPVLLKNVPKDALVAKEETFGPLCPIFSFETAEEVVKYANDTELGLASYVFSTNVNTIYSVAEALEAGMVSCNTGLFSECAFPFGGVKESGFGREGSLYGIEDYTTVKGVAIGGLPKIA